MKEKKEKNIELSNTRETNIDDITVESINEPVLTRQSIRERKNQKENNNKDK
jgi:hypothetical protein